MEDKFLLQKTSIQLKLYLKHSYHTMLPGKKVSFADRDMSSKQMLDTLQMVKLSQIVKKGEITLQ